MKLKLRTVFVSISAAAFLTGQIAGTQVNQAVPADQPEASTAKPVPPTTKSRKGKAAVPAEPEDTSASAKPYVIGPLDVLSISVWNDPKLSGFFPVGPDGMISMQLIGAFKADGLTVRELTDLIKKKLNATVMEDPEVNVQVEKNNSKKFYIYGGCQRQGEFPLTGEMTIMDAFANCGGFRDFANVKKIYILRGTEQIPFNYKDVSHGKHLEQNRRLQNGDRIFVPE